MRWRSNATMWCVMAVAWGGLLATANAQPDDRECAPNERVDTLRFARQVSLDVRGHVPDVEELEALRDAPDPDQALQKMLDTWLESDAFFEQVRRHHEILFWSSLEGLQQVTHEDLHLGGHPYRYLNFDDETDEERRARKAAHQDILARWGGWPRTVRGRGITQNHNFCLAVEQTEFDAEGRPVPMETYRCVDRAANPTEAATTDVGYGEGVCVKEGFVYVEPYWAPGTTVKVCAFDAMAFELDRDGERCDGTQGQNPDCGCGPRLQYCNAAVPDEAFRASLAEEPGRIVEQVIRQRRPYHEAFTQRDTIVNGALAHYYHYFANHDFRSLGFDSRWVVSDPAASPPSLPFDAPWQTMPRDEVHAGALTTAGYLLRIGSNRGRANRFYTAFLCDPFVPSEEGIPAEEANPHPNLRTRAGCEGCHNVLEPAAAHWGRWRINGTYGYMSPEDYDMTTPYSGCRCEEGRCNKLCNTYYVTPDNSAPQTLEEYAGLPLSSVYLDAEEMMAIEQGPSSLLDSAAERTKLATCTVKRTAEHLLGRALGPEDAGWLAGHVEAFEASDQDYVSMYGALLRDPKYRSIR